MCMEKAGGLSRVEINKMASETIGAVKGCVLEGMPLECEGNIWSYINQFLMLMNHEDY